MMVNDMGDSISIGIMDQIEDVETTGVPSGL